MKPAKNNGPTEPALAPEGAGKGREGTDRALLSGAGALDWRRRSRRREALREGVVRRAAPAWRGEGGEAGTVK